MFSPRTRLPLPVRKERGEGHPTADTPTHLQARRPSSSQPSPPSAGGEGEEASGLITYSAARVFHCPSGLRQGRQRGDGALMGLPHGQPVSEELFNGLPGEQRSEAVSLFEGDRKSPAPVGFSRIEPHVVNPSV